MIQLSSDFPEHHSFKFELPSQISISEKKKEGSLRGGHLHVLGGSNPTPPACLGLELFIQNPQVYRSIFHVCCRLGQR